MIVVAALLLLLAVGLLAGGLAQGSATLQWGSFTASALAAVLLGLAELRRRRRTPASGPARASAARRPSAASGRSAATADQPGPPVTAPEMRVSGSTAPQHPAPEHLAPEHPAPEHLVPEHLAPEYLAPEHLAPEPTSLEPAPPQVSAAAPPAVSLGALAEPLGSPSGAHAAPDWPAVPSAPRSGGAHSAEQPAALALGEDGEPPVEEVEVTDLLLVLDLTDEVLVVDEHPRYHLAGCPHLSDQQTFGIPMVEARTDGFTPCGTCAPDRHLAMSERARRSGR